MNITCNECGKFLFVSDSTSQGHNGFLAQQKGFIFKMPVLFTDKYQFLFFCCSSCMRSFYDKNIPKNEEVSQQLEQFRKDIPRMSKECCEGLAKLQESIIELTKNRRKNGNNCKKI